MAHPQLDAGRLALLLAALDLLLSAVEVLVRVFGS